ncbi:hypothetical protein BLNAU_21229 [Blattamonas nauphoetae]|uniref:Right handed beta helix domain-containing protein n=1 Tax=Blattamonas nauphoetae TaxID=2049346 RepID=A0ABQ9WWG2_9EUKA|nr:hypothetical protein BLNAU_21229 [Blattamonas nauphoetae]
MLLSLFAVFAHIHSASIDLQDVIKEYADDVTTINLLDGSYFARGLHLANRDLTFLGREETVSLDLHECDVPAFFLENSSLTLVTFIVQPSPKAAIAQAQQDSILNFTSCEFKTVEFSKPILCGTRSKLIMNGTFVSDGVFFSSLIEGPADTADPHLALVVDNSGFSNLENKAQKPVLAGQDVQNVIIFNSTFKRLLCQEDGELPTKPVEGVANRSVVITASTVEYVAGALGGGLVYGLQASFLSLTNVRWIWGSNAPRFWDNVVFSKSIEVKIDSCNFSFSGTASPYLQNGGFLYLPHDTVNVTISNSTIFHPTTPNGHGGFIYTTGRSTITVEQCRIDNAEAGKSGAFIYAGKGVDAVTLVEVTFALSGAQEGGGLINLDGVKSFQARSVIFSACHVQKEGGLVYFNRSDNPSINFDNCIFVQNLQDPKKRYDVVIHYRTESKYNVKRKNFKNCTSTSRDRVHILPDDRRADWTNSRQTTIASTVAGVIIGVCVIIAVAFVLTFVSCYCGWCDASGCGRKKTGAYQHVESQAIATSGHTQPYSDRHMSLYQK